MADLQGKGAWQARAYYVSRRWFDASVVAVRTVFVGIWLGLLDREALHAADELYYRQARMYHAESHNLSGLFPWESDVLSRHFKDCRSVLLSSAGGGREVIALERRGLEVFAFECHPELVHAGNELLSREGLKTRIALVRRDECPTTMPICDGAIVGWGGYMLIQEGPRRVKFLQQVRAHVPSGAPLLVSFFARHTDMRYMRLTAAIANVFRRVRARERVEVGDDLVPNFVHYFSEDEIAAELESAGFRMVEFSRTGYPHAVARAVDRGDAA